MHGVGIVRNLVARPDVGDPTVEREDRRTVTEDALAAERAVEVDLHRRTALVLRRLVGSGQTVGLPTLLLVPLVLANLSALHENGAQGDRRDVDHDRELGLGTLVGDTERDVEVARRHEGALALEILLLRTRNVAVGELAAELEDGSVRPVFRHLERGCHREVEFVLVLEPHTVARSGTVVGLGLDLHAVVAELGDELGFDGKEVLGICMVQKQIGHQRDGVITARDLDPRVVVGGERALQPAAEFELVALLADGGPLSPGAGPVEIQ